MKRNVLSESLISKTEWETAQTYWICMKTISTDSKTEKEKKKEIGEKKLKRLKNGNVYKIKTDFEILTFVPTKLPYAT